MTMIKTTQKDRYGNLRSLEIKTEGNNLEVPPMASGIPQYEARGGDAATHPGGPKGSDTVPAWLTPGEFVVNKEATDLFGPQIEQMNDIGREIQDGNMNPNNVPQPWNMEIPMYAFGGDPVNKPIGPGLGISHQYAMEHPNLFRKNFDLSTIVPGSFDRLNERQELINQYADMYNLDPNYLKAVLFTESSGKADAVGDRGMGKGNESFGLGQISKRAFNDLVKDFPKTYKYTWDEVQKDPEANIHSAAWYLKILRDKYLKNIQNQSNDAGKDYGSLMEGILPQHYMYQFYNAGPYSKNAEAAMNANKVMAIKSYLDNEDSSSLQNEVPYIPGTNILNPELGGETPPVDGGPGFWDWLGRVLGTHTNQEKNRPDIGGASNTFIEKPTWNNKGGPIHAWSGQKVRYRDQWGNPIWPDLEEEVNRMLPYAEQYINAGAGKGDGDDLGTEPTSLRVPPMEKVPYNIPSTDELQKAAEIYDKRMKKEKVQELYKNTGIGGKSITPAAEVFMGMGDSMLQDSLFTDLDNIPKVQEANLDTTVKTLENALATGDTNLIGSASDAVENASGALSTANITVAANKTNDAEWKHKYAVSNVKLMEEQVAAISALEAQALANGNPMLANQYRMTKKKLLEKLGEVKEAADIAESNVTSASESEAKVLEDNVITNEAITSEVKEKKLEKLANQVKDAKLEKMYRHLNRMKSKIDEIYTTGPANPKWEQTKGMLNFLFGDLIDGREIGRAIAIYLGSRALGYNHNDTIGFVAKQYLERVDTKNAQLDKFIRENADKFTQESLAEYKRTKGRSKLIPIGKAPRYQGNSKMHYSKEYPNGRWAYEMKHENADGKDVTYWSYSKTGDMPVSAYSSDVHTDASRIPGTNEYEAKLMPRVNQIVKILEGQMKKSGDQYKTGVDKWKQPEWKQWTALDPTAAGWSIARWAEENGFRLQELNQGLPQAYSLMVQDTKRKAEEDKNYTKPSDIIPYLEDSMIKPLLTSRAAELVTANVNNDVVSTDTEKLKEINRKANQLAKQIGTTTTNFWNVVMKEWTRTDNKQHENTGMTHQQEYIKEYNKKKDKGLTPFALFAIDYIDLKHIEEKS